MMKYAWVAVVLLALTAWQYMGSTETTTAITTSPSITKDHGVPESRQSTTTGTTSSAAAKNNNTGADLDVGLEDQLKLAKQFATRLSNFRFQKLAKVKATRLGGSEWFINDDIIASRLQHHDPNDDGCLVYSFGVGERDDYTELMAQRGCHVFAFDPTVRHPTHWLPNVTFYPWGLRNSESTREWSHPVYGNITGSFFTFPEIIQKLGHYDDQRTITAIKFDCEGCEFGAFKDLVVGQVKNPILILNTEFHFASTLGMKDVQDVARIYYAHVYLKRNKCKILHYKRNPGFDSDENMVPAALTEVGVNKRFCCYELNYICGNVTSLVEAIPGV